MLRTDFSLFVALSWMMTTCASLPAQDNSDGALLRKIFANYKIQQDEVKSARFSFEATQAISTRPQPSTHAELLEAAKRGHQQSRQHPIEAEATAEAADTVIENSFNEMIIFAGYDGACRITSDRPIFAPADSRVFQSSSDVTFDGKDHSKSLHTQEGRPGHQGSAYPGEMKNRDIHTLAYAPLFLALRAFDADYTCGPVLDKYTLVDTGTQLAGSQSNHRSIQLRASDSFDIWLNAEDYSLQKFVYHFKSGRIFGVVEVSETAREDGVWVPTKWMCTYYGLDGKPQSFYEYSVSDFQLNPPLERDDFLLEFPAETVVADASETPPESKQYIVKHSYKDERGETRRLSEEAAVVVGLEGHSALVDEGRFGIWFYANIIILMLLIFILVFWKYKSSAK